MVAIVSGSGLGLSTSSLATLGQKGVLGVPGLGNTGEQAFVNIATGNLVLQDRDDRLVDEGLDIGVLRTYNSQGLADDDNGDNWSTGFFVKNLLISGTPNGAGSSVTRVDRDGARSVYTFDAASRTYTSTEGAGAYDVIAYNAGSSSFTWTDGASGTTERYNRTDGRLASTTDAQGNTVSYEYDTGLLSRVVAPSGESINYDYITGRRATDITGMVVRTLAADQTQLSRVDYDYDDGGRIGTVTVDLTPQNSADNVSYATTYTYEGTSNRVNSITQADGTSVTFKYVQTGSFFSSTYRVASVTDGLGKITAFTYDTTSRRTTVTDPLGRVTAYEYDTSKQLTRVVSPAIAGVSQATSFAYNGNGDLTGVTDAAGGTIAMQYDADGNQVLQRDAAGNTVARTYDALNQLLTEAVYAVPDPDGAGPAQAAQPLVTRYVYDTGNQHLLRFVVSGEGRVTEHQYSALGERLATLTYTGAEYDTSALAATAVPTLAQMSTWATDKPPLGLERVDMAYDFRGQLKTRTVWATTNSVGAGVADGKQSVTTSIYDHAGRLLQTVSPGNGTTLFGYDGLGRVTSTSNALGQVTLVSYDAAHNAIKTTSANGLVTTRIFDKDGRLASVAQSNSAGTILGTSTYFYDALGRLAMTQDPTGVRSWNLYDEAGRKVADIDGDGSLTEYIYNANNQVTHTIAYATAVNTTLLVSATGQPLNPTLASVRPAISAAADRHSWNAYDSAGRLVKTVDAQGAVVETRYDGASRVVSVIGYATLISTTALGNTPSAASIAPATNAQDRIQRNFYDADGLLRGRLDGEGVLTEYRYDSAGHLIRSIRYATGTAAALRATGTLAQLIPATSAADAITIYLTNAKGQVAGEVDAEGYLTERVYDANGNQSQTVRYATKVSATITDSSTVAQLRPAANAQDHATSCVYDKLNRKTQETDAQGTVTQYSYDATGNLVRTDRAVGSNEVRLLNARFDLQGRLTGELTAEGALLLTGNQTQAQIDAIWSQYGLTHAYDAAGRRMSTIDQNGYKTLFFYNVDGHLTHTVNALGEVTENQYNTLDQQVATVRYGTRISLANLTGANAGGLGNTVLTGAVNIIKNPVLDSKTSFGYNKTGTLATATDALGFATNYVYNAFSEQVSRTQAIGSSQTVAESLSYDRRGLLLDDTLDTGTGGINALTSTRYDAFGRITSWTDANGNTRTSNYDRLGRAISTINALGQTQSASYDAFDRVLTQTDALGKTTTYQYDSTQRSMSVTTPEGVTVTTFFTRLGQTQSVRDGRGNTTTFGYDKNGNLLTTTTALTTSTNVYDRANLLKTVIDANGNQVTLGYDAANRVITRTVDPGGLNLITRYGYDAKGQQITITDANGFVTQFSFDLKGQLFKQVVDQSGLNLVTLFTFDGRGKTLTVTMPNGNNVLYTYDKLGRRTREQTDPNGLNITRSWAYDALGNVTSATDGNGNVSRFAYDAENRLVFSVDGAGDVVQNTYDADGRQIKSVQYATAISLATLPVAATVAQIQSRVAGDVSIDATEHRVYDDDGRITATVSGMGQVVNYVYDANGNVIDRIAYANAVTGWTPGSAVNPVADAAHDQRLRTVYDQLDRAIFSIDGAGALVARSYDGNGNVIARTAFATAADAATPATQADLGAAAALIAAPGRDAVIRSVDDKANRLIWSADGVGAVTRRVYDGNGNVIRLTQFANTVGAAADPASVVASAATDRVTVMTYDAANRAVFTLDALGDVLRQGYDANGNLTLRTSYSKAISTSLSTTAAIEQALVAARDDLNDRTERYAFDAANRQVFAIDAAGAVTETRYDGAGNAVKSIRHATAIVNTASLTPASTALTVGGLVTNDSTRDRTVTRAFDAANRVAYSVDPMGYVTESTYDAIGRATGTVLYSAALTGVVPTTLAGIKQAIVKHPADDRAETCVYDGAGRLVSCTDALGFTETYAYNALGEKTSFTNASINHDTWQYDYDAAGRMVKETSPEVARAVAGIDVNGNLTFEGGTLANAKIFTLMAYDALGNLLSRTEAQGLAEQRITSYEYDALGRQVKTTYPQVGVYHLGNDSAANGASGLASRVDTPQVLTTTTIYDALGNAIAGTDMAGNYSYKAYDKLGQVVYDVDAMGYVVKYERNPFGEVSKLTRYAQGITLSPGAVGLTQTQVSGALMLSAGVDRSLSTTYDRAGRVAKVTEPQSLTFDSISGTAAVQASKVTENSYNAFGDLVLSACQPHLACRPNERFLEISAARIRFQGPTRRSSVWPASLVCLILEQFRPPGRVHPRRMRTASNLWLLEQLSAFALTAHVIAHQLPAQRLDPLPFGLGVGFLHVLHRLALPGFLGRQASQGLMRPHYVVEILEFVQRCLQRLHGFKPHLAQQRLERAEQALDAPVVPGLPGRAASVNDAQRLERRAPHHAGEHGFIVGADRKGQAMFAQGQEQMPDQRERALARQHLQVQQLARTRIDDAQDGEGQAIGRLDERQVQRPGVAHGNEVGRAALALAAQALDFLCVVFDQLRHPALAHCGPAALPAIESIGDLAAAMQVAGEVKHVVAHPLRLGARVRGGARRELVERFLRGPSVDRHLVQLPMATQPEDQADAGPKRLGQQGGNCDGNNDRAHARYIAIPCARFSRPAGPLLPCASSTTALPPPKSPQFSERWTLDVAIEQRSCPNFVKASNKSFARAQKVSGPCHRANSVVDGTPSSHSFASTPPGPYRAWRALRSAPQLDQLDILLEQVIDQGGQLHALGAGTRREWPAPAGPGTPANSAAHRPCGTDRACHPRNRSRRASRHRCAWPVGSSCSPNGVRPHTAGARAAWPRAPK